METWSNAAQQLNISPGDLGLGGDAPIFANLPLPFSLKKIQPEIKFYIKRSGETKEILFLDHNSDEDDIKNEPRFVRYLNRCDNRIILITHGFLSGSDVDWLVEMRDALLGVEKQVVFVVGWKGGAHFTNYDPIDAFVEPNVYKQAAANCLAVGEWVGIVVTWLQRPGIYGGLGIA